MFDWIPPAAKELKGEVVELYWVFLVIVVLVSVILNFFKVAEGRGSPKEILQRMAVSILLLWSFDDVINTTSLITDGITDKLGGTEGLRTLYEEIKRKYVENSPSLPQLPPNVPLCGQCGMLPYRPSWVLCNQCFDPFLLHDPLSIESPYDPCLCEPIHGVHNGQPLQGTSAHFLLENPLVPDGGSFVEAVHGSQGRRWGIHLYACNDELLHRGFHAHDPLLCQEFTQ